MKTNVLQYLEDSARKFPEKVALVDGTSEITYLDCYNKARSVGFWLVGKREADLAAPAPVAVFIGRNVNTVVAFLGCVYGGCFYVPIDPAMPAARISLILETVKPAAVLNASGKAVSGWESEDIENLLHGRIDPQVLEAIREQSMDLDPLYAMFTSGSTGVPKGVLISHRGVIDMAEQFGSTFGFEASDVFANQAPFDFDVSVKDIYNALRVGAKVQIVPKSLFMTPVKLVQYLNEHRITTMIWAVSALRILADFDVFSRVKLVSPSRIMFSGEMMPMKTLKYLMHHLEKSQFVNLYGPTEITCNCTYYIIPRDISWDRPLPIGQAFRNCRVFLLDEQGDLLREPNRKGELCISGSCLALGYYNAPEKTAAAFRPDPHIPGYHAMVYHSGDLAYYDENGLLVFSSRADFQIKHMGHRIELGEIEAVLSDFAQVHVACCLFDHAANKIICFYESEEACKKELVLHLKQYLPKYMWPNQFVHFQKLPMSKNGKIDRQELKARYESGSFGKE